jgi:hypothetical protein
MQSYEFQIDVDPDAGITIHFKQPGKGVEVRPAASEIELYQRLLDISDEITQALPEPLKSKRFTRRVQIDNLTDLLRGAFQARAAMASGGLGELNTFNPVPRVPGLLKDPRAGCAALCHLINELMEGGGQFAEEEVTPPCIDEG